MTAMDNTNTDQPPLPAAAHLNIGALAALFRHTTNSYKFVFFLALLNLLKRHRFDGTRPYSYAEIVVEMLAIAWYPHSYFKLSFGAQDTIAHKLDALDLNSAANAHRFIRDSQALRGALESRDLKDAQRLMDFVPYRLLIPFLEPQLQGIDKGAWMVFEQAMPAITNAHFTSVRPLYRFNSDDYRCCTQLHIHPDWAAYLHEHYGIIQGWASWHWLHYMQRRNPSTPALACKLFPPTQRSALTPQTRYWRTILQHPDCPELRCIYSGVPLRVASFALDHYLPWSFVVHDQLWNLIPVPAAVNSAKSNRLPSADYFSGFVTLQHQGLLIARQSLGDARFGRAVEDYLNDLQLPTLDALLDFDHLRRAYEQNIGPLLTLAAHQGFTPDWHYTG